MQGSRCTRGVATKSTTPSSRSKSPSHARLVKSTSQNASSGRQGKAALTAARYSTAQSEEQIHDTHRDLDRCATLLDSLMQASTDTDQPRSQLARGRAAAASNGCRPRSGTSDQNAQAMRQPVAGAAVSVAGAHYRSRSWTRPARKLVPSPALAKEKRPTTGKAHKVSAVPVRGMSTTSARRTSHLQSGKASRSTSARGAGGRSSSQVRRPPSELEWTFDSGSDGGIICMPSRHVRRKSDPSVSVETAVPKSSLDGAGEAISNGRQEDVEVQFDSMETTDLLQALLTRTIDTGDSVLQQMVLALCSTALKPWITSQQPPAVALKARSESSAADSRPNLGDPVSDSEASNALKSENAMLKRKLQEALQKAQVAKNRLKDVEKLYLEAQTLQDSFNAEQELTVTLREQLVKKTSELDQLFQAKEAEKDRMQKKISSVESQLQQQITAARSSRVHSLQYTKPFESTTTVQPLHPAAVVATSSAPGLMPSSYMSVTNVRSCMSTASSKDEPTSAASTTIQATAEESSFMRLPSLSSLLVDRHAVSESAPSDSGADELTVANVRAFDKVHPAVKLSEQASRIPTSPYLPDSVADRTLTSIPDSESTLNIAGERVQHPAAAGRTSFTSCSGIAPIPDIISAAVAELDLNSSVSSLDTMVPNTKQSFSLQRPIASTSTTAFIEPVALSMGGDGGVPSSSSGGSGNVLTRNFVLADLASVSDITGSYADEEFQAGMAALDAGIQRLRQQLNTGSAAS
ncbi:uncharacterized protein LOC135823622 isoform X1 [Sycon ciliatum]|uniref:uncharacterized protein LOC135823622 isoform X1 n=2 Tax=Sycon ciliatum TaxID=27933 RepID=UPI0031F70BCB